MKRTVKLVLNQETLRNLTEWRHMSAVPITSNYTYREPCCACSVKEVREA